MFTKSFSNTKGAAVIEYGILTALIGVLSISSVGVVADRAGWTLAASSDTIGSTLETAAGSGDSSGGGLSGGDGTGEVDESSTPETHPPAIHDPVEMVLRPATATFGSSLPSGIQARDTTNVTSPDVITFMAAGGDLQAFCAYAFLFHQTQSNHFNTAFSTTDFSWVDEVQAVPVFSGLAIWAPFEVENVRQFARFPDGSVDFTVSDGPAPWFENVRCVRP